MARQVARKRITEDGAPGRARAHQRRRRHYDELGDCDLVIEAATEKEEVKRKIFADALRRR